MTISGTTKIPAKLKRALERELDSHMKTHLQSDHLKHIQAAKKRLAQPPRGSAKKERTPRPRSIQDLQSDLAPVARAGLRELRAGGWVLLVQTSPGLLAMVEFQPEKKEFRLVRVTTGAAAEEMSAARKKLLERHPRQQARELRFLTFPPCTSWRSGCIFPNARKTTSSALFRSILPGCGKGGRIPDPPLKSFCVAMPAI